MRTAKRFAADLAALTLLLFGGLCLLAGTPAAAEAAGGPAMWVVPQEVPAGMSNVTAAASDGFVENVELTPIAAERCSDTITQTCPTESNGRCSGSSPQSCSDGGTCTCQSEDVGSTYYCACNN